MEFSNDTTVRIYFRPWGKERVETANCRAEVNTWCGQGWLIPHVKYSGAPSFFLLRQIREVPTKKLKICWRGFRGLDARGGGGIATAVLPGFFGGPDEWVDWPLLGRLFPYGGARKTAVEQWPGSGPYASHSLAIFCSWQWREKAIEPLKGFPCVVSLVTDEYQSESHGQKPYRRSPVSRSPPTYEYSNSSHILPFYSIFHQPKSNRTTNPFSYSNF